METMSRSLLSAASLVLATIICIGLACGAGNSAGALPVAKQAAGRIAGAKQKPEADVAASGGALQLHAAGERRHQPLREGSERDADGRRSRGAIARESGVRAVPPSDARPGVAGAGPGE